MVNTSQILIQVIIFILLIDTTSCVLPNYTYINNINLQNPNTSQKKFTQRVDYEYFYFNKDKNAFEGLEYIIFEVTISSDDMKNIIQNSDVYPILCYDFGKDPDIKITDQKIDSSSCKGFDYNQYIRTNGKYFKQNGQYVSQIGQYSLYIEPDNNQLDSIRILVFISGFSFEYTYILKAKYRDSDQPVCPFDCKNSDKDIKGVCQNGKCQCQIGTVDYDCSQSATLIGNQQTKLQVSSDKMKYMYYRPESRTKDLNSVSDIILSFSLLNSSPPVDMYVSIEDVDPYVVVPTNQVFLQKFSIQEDDLTLTLRSNGQYDQFGEPKYTVLGFLIKDGTEQSNQVVVTINDDEEETTNTNMIIIYFLVGVVSLLFLIWIILTIIKIRYSRRNQVVDLSLAQAQLNAAQQRQQQRRGQSNKLTPEIIDQFLPSSTFEEVKKKQQSKGKSSTDACAVCLCEFEDTDICRETICNHYFHKDCLEQWLKKQENCPFCRTELSRACLVKYFEALKLQSDSPDNKNNENQQQNNADYQINGENQQQNVSINQNVNSNVQIHSPANNINENSPLQSNNVNNNPTNRNQVQQRNQNISNQLIIQRNVPGQNSSMQSNLQRQQQNNNISEVQELNLIH